MAAGEDQAYGDQFGQTENTRPYGDSTGPYVTRTSLSAAASSRRRLYSQLDNARLRADLPVANAWREPGSELSSASARRGGGRTIWRGLERVGTKRRGRRGQRSPTVELSVRHGRSGTDDGGQRSRARLAPAASGTDRRWPAGPERDWRRQLQVRADVASRSPSAIGPSSSGTGDGGQPIPERNWPSSFRYGRRWPAEHRVRSGPAPPGGVTLTGRSRGRLGPSSFGSGRRWPPNTEHDRAQHRQHGSR
jgi:hypothetical protein